MMKKQKRGQALVEYLLVFSFLVLILFQFIKGINVVMGKSLGAMRVILSKELSTGMCTGDEVKGQCLHRDLYKN